MNRIATLLVWAAAGTGGTMDDFQVDADDAQTVAIVAETLNDGQRKLLDKVPVWIIIRTCEEALKLELV